VLCEELFFLKRDFPRFLAEAELTINAVTSKTLVKIVILRVISFLLVAKGLEKRFFTDLPSEKRDEVLQRSWEKCRSRAEHDEPLFGAKRDTDAFYADSITQNRTCCAGPATFALHACYWKWRNVK